MNLYIDIETIPTQRTDLIVEIKNAATAGLTADEDKIRAKYKKQETIDAHIADLQSNAPALVDAAHRKTALDGTYGEIVCICWALDDGPVEAAYRDIGQHEADILKVFYDALPAPTYHALEWVGHNISGFDMRFLMQRSVVRGVKPSVTIPVEDRRRDKVFDTMTEWAGRYDRSSWPSLDKLCRALSIESPKGSMTGADVYDAVMAGKLDDVVEYCVQDVEAVRRVYKAMTWGMA